MGSELKRVALVVFYVGDGLHVFGGKEPRDDEDEATCLVLYLVAYSDAVDVHVLSFYACLLCCYAVACGVLVCYALSLGFGSQRRREKEAIPLMNWLNCVQLTYTQR